MSKRSSGADSPGNSGSSKRGRQQPVRESDDEHVANTAPNRNFGQPIFMGNQSGSFQQLLASSQHNYFGMPTGMGRGTETSFSYGMSPFGMTSPFVTDTSHFGVPTGFGTVVPFGTGRPTACGMGRSTAFGTGWPIPTDYGTGGPTRGSIRTGCETGVYSRGIPTARKLNEPPYWLTSSAWAVLQEYWQNEKYANLRTTNKANRWKQLNPTTPIRRPRGTHRSGSMSFSRRIAKLAEELGREPSVLELYQNMHIRPDGSRIDNVSLASFIEQLTQHLEEEDMRLGVQDRELTDSENVAPTNMAWMVAHGVDPHGRVLGLGSETSNFRERHVHHRPTAHADPIIITERLSQVTTDQHNMRVDVEQNGSGSKKGKGKTPATQSTPRARD